MKTLKAGATTRLYYFKKATFMAFTTKVITDTSPDFGDNPQVITESGKPASVEVDNLIPNTAHWTKAEIWQDGVLNDTSDVETFTTLQAGVITLEYIQTVRSGYGYDVVYRYTSTYAPSSAVLATNGTQFQGFIDSAQNTVSFWVTGLTAGTAYLTNVTMYDIYAESVTVTGSIVTTVVNEIRITNTTPSETEVECELDYVIDSGFNEGYVEYWLATQDPATEQTQGHFYFNNGDTSVTADGLTAGTAYLFRATLLLGDGTTEIHSSVVSASTTAIEYFRITNETSSANTIAMYYKGNDISSKRTVEYSTDEGITWNRQTRSGSGSSVAIIYVKLKSKGKSILVRGDYSYNSTTGNNYVYFLPTANYSVSGNLFTLTRNSVIQAGNKASITSAGEFEFDRLFEDSDKLIDASNLTINNITSVGYSSFLWTFRGCEALKGAPNFSSIKNVGEKGFCYAFSRCLQLSSTPNFDRVEIVGDNGFEHAFGACKKITSTPDFRNVVNVGNNGFFYAFTGCNLLTTAFTPNVSAWDTSIFEGWLNVTAATGVVHKPRNLTIPTDTTSGVPTGWTTQDY